MRENAATKVTAAHLARSAYLYVRQSTVRQVFENQESTKRQYALRERAVALGWTTEQVVVIDEDLGVSGAVKDREGFARLVAEVGLARAGIVLGLEVSRLARNSTDWHRLLEICALTDTLILDEDGIYDPANFNDRLLLGLKGTMSEAELHVLRARLRGGILNKARRGELRLALPVGFVYGPGGVLIDPDVQVQQSVRMIFDTFRRTGSARQVVKHFAERGLLFPWRVPRGPRRAETVWRAPDHSRVIHVLHNPTYTGAFTYGRRRHRKLPDGAQRQQKLPQEEWTVLLKGAHAGYITWEEYEENQRRLAANAVAHGADRRAGPAREGAALLQGVVLCGQCGSRMSIRYDCRGDVTVPVYTCLRLSIQRHGAKCQWIAGAGIDEAVGKLLVESVTPLALDVALEVQRELAARAAEAERLRRAGVERARYEADLARRRFLQVDPANRLVADALEADWNEKLRTVRTAEEEHERGTARDGSVLDDAQRAQVLALATDFPRLWRDPATPQRERKRLLRLLIEDVTLRRGKTGIDVHVRFRGGATQSLVLSAPRCSWELRRTNPKVVAEVNRLLDEHTDAEVAALLDAQGLHPGVLPRFTPERVGYIRRTYGLRSLRDRLHAQGLLSIEQLAAKLHVAKNTIRNWQKAGLLRCRRYGQQNRFVYEDPGDEAPASAPGWKLSERPRPRALRETAEEVQCEA